LDYKYIGPYEIVEQVNELSFRLKLPDTMRVHDVFHVSLLEPHVANDIDGRIVPPPPPVFFPDSNREDEDDQVGHVEYEVSKILDKRIRRKKVQYLVEWLGYGIDHRSWEPVENLVNSEQLIRAYEANAVPERRVKRSRRH
jgi:hypothetical protein